MLHRLSLPPRPPADPDHEERTHLDGRSDAVRDVVERPAPVEAQRAALTSSVRTDVRRVHP